MGWFVIEIAGGYSLVQFRIMNKFTVNSPAHGESLFYHTQTFRNSIGKPELGRVAIRVDKPIISRVGGPRHCDTEHEQ